MKLKATIPFQSPAAKPMILGIADRLSQEPLLRMLGPKFKVIVDVDSERKRVTYSFRAPDHFDSDDKLSD